METKLVFPENKRQFIILVIIDDFFGGIRLGWSELFNPNWQSRSFQWLQSGKSSPYTMNLGFTKAIPNNFAATIGK